MIAPLDPNDPIEWIAAHLSPRPSAAVEFLYDHMESQSGEQLAVIYVPFDGRRRGHFADRGAILDYAIHAQGGRALDFGPGDGWPSLLLAPMVEDVIGVDGSAKRVDVCTRNADRLGIENARFVHVPPGSPLPFDDSTFDAVAAASSIEQTPDPRVTLREIRRVLRPGGRLRMHYESLGGYRGREREIWLVSAGASRTHLVIYDRGIDAEHVDHYGLAIALGRVEVERTFAGAGVQPSYDGLTARVLRELLPHVIEAVAWTTQHPSAVTWLRWLNEIGFASAVPTRDGGWIAERVFDRLPESDRPREMDAVDAMVHPHVLGAVTTRAPSPSSPGEWDPWITAVR
jgi:SAM-dependent methyltransferase